MASTLKTLGLAGLFCAVWLAGSPRALAVTQDRHPQSHAVLTQGQDLPTTASLPGTD